MFTCLTLNSSVSWNTVACIQVNIVDTSCSVLTRITGTFVDICEKNERQAANYHNSIESQFEYFSQNVLQKQFTKVPKCEIRESD